MSAITEEELSLIRKSTAGVSNVIHLNNAGASLPPDVVVKTVMDYLKTEAWNGGYETEGRCLDKINSVYDAVAGLINAQSSEIALFENASAAWTTAFKGIHFEQGDEILISEMEYVTNLIALVDIQEQFKVKIITIPLDEDGNFH